MLSFLTNLKNYWYFPIIIALLCWNLLQCYQHERMASAYFVCQADNLAKDMAIKQAQELATQQEQKIRLREQEAAKAQAESDKRRDKIMAYRFSDNCDEAIQQGIGQI